MNHRTVIHRVASISAALILIVGCESNPEPDNSVLVIRDSAKPVLTTGAGERISLFGGLPRRGSAPFVGRSLGAMLQHSFTREGSDFDCQLDANGKRFVFASTRHHQNPDLYIKAVDGTAVVQLTGDPASDAHPAFSPDMQRVAFASDRSGNWDIWVIGADGQRPMQITDTPMDEVHPSWSPDGNRIVYSALPRKTGQWELWIVPAQEHATSTFVGYGVFPEWSPVDDTILFQRARQRGGRWFSVWTLRLVNGEPRYPTEIASSADYALVTPSFSRDGRRIAYATVPGVSPIDPQFQSVYELSDIWVMDVDGGYRVRLTDGHTTNFSPTWAPDGRVLFTSTRSGHQNIWSIRPPNSGVTVPGNQRPTSVVRTGAVSRNGS